MSQTFWLRVSLLLPLAVGLEVALHVTASLSADVGSVGAFVTAVGTLYSVLAGFTVVSVWTGFTDTDRAVKREARALSELWRYVGYVGDSAGVTRARTAIEAYREEVIGKEWEATVRRESPSAAEDEFLAMVDAVAGIKVATARDVPAWTEALRMLGDVSDARGERVILIGLRMPRLLRWLLYTATLSLLGGVLLLGFDSAVVGGLVVGFTVTVSLLVLEVIDDIDDPIGGAWGITFDPFARIRFHDS